MVQFISHLLSRPPEHPALCASEALIQECVSMATLACAHGPTVLTNCEPSELVAECILYALQVQTTWTI